MYQEFGDINQAPAVSRVYERRIRKLAFVDPIFSGSALAQRLHLAGIEIIAMITDKTYLDCPHTQASLKAFDQVIYIDVNDLKQSIQSLKKLKIDRIYYGYEKSVAICDELANALTPRYSNNVETSSARFNKFDMQEALSKRKIECVRQIKVKNKLLDSQHYELEEWQSKFVIKPMNEYGGYGIHVCETIVDVENYLQEAKNKSSEQNIEFVVQEYLQGEEYFIDVFCLSGKAFIGGIQRSHRELVNQKPLCKYTEVTLPNNPAANQLVAYTKKVTGAVELLNGFAHIEIMLTENGPRLIEINPRISGAVGMNLKLFETCGIHTQIDRLFCASGILPLRKTASMNGRKVYLQSLHNKMMGKLNVELLKTLPSFVDSLQNKSVGTEIGFPADITDVVGFIILAHESNVQLEQDYQQLMSWQNNGELY